ncbi:MAG: hypothetical protein M3N57_05430, partial [Actinomycetota bacterium]|nr:hypothetical protein [Actinomycetota bacterium]
MRKLLLHHTYTGGRAVDVSGNRNHGHVHDAPQAGPSSLRFQQPSSRVTAYPAPGTFDRIDSLEVTVRFRLGTVAQRRTAARASSLPVFVDLDRPWTTSGRHNLVEGHLSFALYIESVQLPPIPAMALFGTWTLRMRATILDATGSWTGPAGEVRVSGYGWHTATLVYEAPAARLVLAFDGDVIGTTVGVQGPVRPVGPNGVAIGHWPEPDSRYTLKGDIDDLRVWATWPEVEDLVDPCCADRDGVGELLHDSLADDEGRDVRTGPDPTEAIREIVAINAAIRARLVGTSEELAERARDAELAFGRALRDHDLPAMVAAVQSGARLLVDAGVPEDWLASQGEQALNVLMRFPVGRRVLGPVVSAARRVRRTRRGRRDAANEAAVL